jgi:hypothetical protein
VAMEGRTCGKCGVQPAGPGGVLCPAASKPSLSVWPTTGTARTRTRFTPLSLRTHQPCPDGTRSRSCMDCLQQNQLRLVFGGLLRVHRSRTPVFSGRRAMVRWVTVGRVTLGSSVRRPSGFRRVVVGGGMARASGREGSRPPTAVAPMLPLRIAVACLMAPSGSTSTSTTATFTEPVNVILLVLGLVDRRQLSAHRA